MELQDVTQPFHISLSRGTWSIYPYDFKNVNNQVENTLLGYVEDVNVNKAWPKPLKA